MASSHKQTPGREISVPKTVFYIDEDHAILFTNHYLGSMNGDRNLSAGGDFIFYNLQLHDREITSTNCTMISSSLCSY